MKKIFLSMILLLMTIFLCTGCQMHSDLQTRESAEKSGFSIRFLDVGQADSALVECDGHYMLIDGGNREDSSKIYSILKESNIDHLDLIVGTHPDEDHIGGLPGAFNYASAAVTLCSVTDNDTKAFRDFSKYAELNGGGITVPKIGEQYKLGSAVVTILGVNGGEESNDTSIILKLQYKETSFLFTGDAETQAEQAVLNSGADLSSTVLKVGHHGSSDSTSREFLEAVHPEYAIISVGIGNVYAHPTQKTLDQLENANAEIYRTDLQGDITVVSDGKKIKVTTERNASRKELLTGAAASSTIRVLEEEEASGINDSGIGTRGNNEISDYILNTSSKKFHDPECKSVTDMKDKNKSSYRGKREDLIRMGYDPCGNCKP